MSLRDHLLASSSSNASAHQPQYPPVSAQTGPDNPYQQSDSPGSHDHLDHGVGGPQMPYAAMSGDSAGDDMSPQAAKGKRELSTSKRAAQNRAAQRAFRQRKEGYIKKLEEQVKDFQAMEQSFRSLQNENYQLREYILSLQSRLLESSSDVPPAPPHMNLTAGAVPTAQRDRDDSPSTTDARLRQELEQRTPPHSAPTASMGQDHTMKDSPATPRRPPYGVGQENYPAAQRSPEDSDVKPPR